MIVTVDENNTPFHQQNYRSEKDAEKRLGTLVHFFSHLLSILSTSKCLLFIKFHLLNKLVNCKFWYSLLRVCYDFSKISRLCWFPVSNRGSLQNEEVYYSWRVYKKLGISKFLSFFSLLLLLLQFFCKSLYCALYMEYHDTYLDTKIIVSTCLLHICLLRNLSKSLVRSVGSRKLLISSFLFLILVFKEKKIWFEEFLV